MNQTQSQFLNPTQKLVAAVYWVTCVLAAAAFVLEFITLVAGWKLPGARNWPEAVLLLTVLVTTLVSLQRQLPLQNILLAATITAAIGGAAHGLCSVFFIPFGPIHFTGSGPEIFGELPWSLPVLWNVVVLNSRGVVRLILRPWRKMRTYGFWLIGLTAILVVLFDLALEPFATDVKRFWLWRETRFPITWYSMPLTNPLGWLVTSLLILAFATPPLINKQPRRQSPPDYHPLVVWVLAMLLFAAGAASKGLWPAVGYCLMTTATVTAFGVRGGRW